MGIPSRLTLFATEYIVSVTKAIWVRCIKNSQYTVSFTNGLGEVWVNSPNKTWARVSAEFDHQNSLLC